MNDYGFSAQEQLEIKRIFKKNRALEKVILFGSRAKKTAY
jgi:predicted nucleotidyltransferase